MRNTIVLLAVYKNARPSYFYVPAASRTSAVLARGKFFVNKFLIF